MIIDSGYFQDMKVVDERLTALENKVNTLLQTLLKLEQILVYNSNKEEKENA